MSTVDLPKINQPFIDPVSGQISRPWWIWLQQLMTRIGGSGGTDISVLEQLVRDLLELTSDHGKQIDGFTPLPPGDEVSADEGMVYMPPQDLSQTSPVLSVFGRAGNVTAQAGDYTVAQVTNAASVLATLAQFAATTSAQLRGVLSDETGGGLAVFSDQPTLNQPNIVGTTTNDNAVAGSIGEYSSNSASGVALTTSTSASITSLALSAGDWDVSGVVTFVPAATTTVQQIISGISTVNNTLPATNTGGFNLLALTFSTGAAQAFGTNIVRMSLAAPTAVYLIAQATFGVSTMTANGFIRARRVR